MRLKRANECRFKIGASVRTFFLLACVCSVFSACGTMRMDLATDIQSSGVVAQSFNLKADGAMADALKTSYDPTKLRADGWNVDFKREGDTSVWHLKRDFTASNTWFPQASGPTSTSDPTIDFTVQHDTKIGRHG